MATLHRWKKYNKKRNYSLTHKSGTYTGYETHEDDESKSVAYISDKNLKIVEGHLEASSISSSRTTSVPVGSYVIQSGVYGGSETVFLRALNEIGNSPSFSRAYKVTSVGRKTLKLGNQPYVTMGPYYKDIYIENVTSTNRNAYPDDGESGSYWYVYDGIQNQAPTISGSDTDLGNKTNDFSIDYIVSDNDANDKVKVVIELDGKVIDNLESVTSGIKRKIDVSLSGLSLGKHTVKITASDLLGEKAIRTYTFTKMNSAPEINGEDRDLGEKNTAFSIVYQVKDENGDSINVVEKLNGEVLQNLSNVDHNKDMTITITDEKLQELELNKINTIEIEANDGKGGIKYRRITFKRTNSPPIISGNDRDLGEVKEFLSVPYSVTDIEKDEIKVDIYLDDKKVVSEKALEDNKEYKFEVKGFEFHKLNIGYHTVKIVAIDAKGAKSQRILTFTRVVNKLIMELAEPLHETKYIAKEILITPQWAVAEGTKVIVEVCNNAYDDTPTWENATSAVLSNAKHIFTNAVAGEKKGINIRITIEKDKAKDYSYLNGISAFVDF